jgi:hypothetical protein
VRLRNRGFFSFVFWDEITPAPGDLAANSRRMNSWMFGDGGDPYSTSPVDSRGGSGTRHDAEGLTPFCVILALRRLDHGANNPVMSPAAAQIASKTQP